MSEDPEDRRQEHAAESELVSVIEHGAAAPSGADVGKIGLQPAGSQQSTLAVEFENALGQPVEIDARAFLMVAGKQRPVGVTLTKDILSPLEGTLISLAEEDVLSFSSKTSLWLPLYVEIEVSFMGDNSAVDPVRERFWAQAVGMSVALLDENDYRLEVEHMVEQSDVIRDALEEMAQRAAQDGLATTKTHVDQIVEYQPEQP